MRQDEQNGSPKSRRNRLSDLIWPVIGGALGLPGGAVAAIGCVVTYYRSLPPGGSIAVLGEYLRDLLLWGFLGAIGGAFLGGYLGSVLGRWCCDRNQENRVPKI
jgi:hypothetical protein